MFYEMIKKKIHKITYKWLIDNKKKESHASHAKM